MYARAFGDKLSHATIHPGRRTSRRAPLPGNPARFSIHRSIHRIPCARDPHCACNTAMRHWTCVCQRPLRSRITIAMQPAFHSRCAEPSCNSQRQAGGSGRVGAM